MKEIDRETVADLLLNRVRGMIDRDIPGSSDSVQGRAVLAQLEQSQGFQEFVTLQVAELEARMKGQVH